MARPRIFVSSTFYDLRHVRSDLERFIRELGYEPVLNERGTIPYGKEEKLEEYCYREIQNTDILVSLVGGRFGSGSDHGDYSISQMEFKIAHRLGKQTYVFIDKDVRAEFGTYLLNKGTKADIKYRHVDDARIYRYIEELQQLPSNNTISTFEAANDIIQYLKEQWAGLFQRLLQEQIRNREIMVLEELKSAADSLSKIAQDLARERGGRSDEIMKWALFANHPAFSQLKRLIMNSYRIYFETRDELTQWLSVKGFELVSKDQWDSDNEFEWISNSKHGNKLLKVNSCIFDNEGRLKLISNHEWDQTWIQLGDLKPMATAPTIASDDDDIPF